MNYLKLIFFLLFVSLVNHSFAQYKTGDAELDKSVVTIDANARIDFGAFKMDIRNGYNVTDSKLDYLSVKLGMSAGDIYLAVEIAKITKKSLDDVVKIYSANKTKGWGVIAKELGIKPGSPEFHALKGNAKQKGNKPPKAKGNKSK